MLKQITLTGADDEIYIPDLIAISDRFPFVEWGILLSDRRMGEPRYPTYEWIKCLLKRKSPSMRISLHICSEYNRNAAVYSLKKREKIFDGFNRIQFNCGTSLGVRRYFHRLRSVTASRDYPIIIGGNYDGIEEIPDFIMPMYDMSGGNGIEMTKVKEPYYNAEYTGYAGGLNTSNLSIFNKLIQDTAKDKPYWLDMESSLRINGIKFNINKCIEVLTLMEPFIQ